MKRYFVLVWCWAMLGVCGCKHCDNKQSAPADAFALTDLLIGSGLKGIEKPTNRFTQATPIRMSYDIANCTAMKINGVPVIWLRQDAIVRDEQGNVVRVFPSLVDKKIPVAEKPLKYENVISLAGIEGLKEGRYEITLLATDLVSFKTNTQSLLIRITQ